MARVASIDIGTYTVRLAVADVIGGRVVRMAKQSTICDLGEGVDATGRLADAAIARVLECVDAYLAALMGTQAQAVVCTLTSAARDAENSAQLTDALVARGLAPEVIPGEVEGSLTFLGIAQDFPGKRIAIADPGGGSTELAVGRLDEQGAVQLEFVRSLAVGCRRVTDRFLSGAGPASADDVAAARAYCRETFGGALEEAGLAELPDELVCVGGTATSLVAVDLAMGEYDASRVHLARLARTRIDEMIDELAALDVADRGRLPGLQAKRAPVILGGAIVLSELAGAFGVDELVVSESDLLFGLSLTSAALIEGTTPPISWQPAMRA